jgi:hypothetical protein
MAIMYAVSEHKTCYLELDTEQGRDWQRPWAHGPTHDPFVSIETL